MAKRKTEIPTTVTTPAGRRQAGGFAPESCAGGGMESCSPGGATYSKAGGGMKQKTGGGMKSEIGGGTCNCGACALCTGGGTNKTGGGC